MNDRDLRMICVVDDDKDVCDSMRALLESAGFCVRTAASAAEFLQAPDVAAASCLLLDLQMPGMSGVELLELLRARQIHTPVIFITASGERLAARMMQAGAATILKKPVQGDELLRWIAWACSGGARPDK